MTQQPFSRPGAIDLSALKRPAAPAPSRRPGASGRPGRPPERAVAGRRTPWTSPRRTSRRRIEASMTAPVLLVFYSRTRMPESGQLADDLRTLADEFEGRFLAGLVDIDAAPAIAQAMQIPSIPLVVAVIDGRPAPLLQDALPLEELRTALTQVMQQLTAQGITGRHQPRAGAPVEAADEGEEPQVDPRYAAAQEALGDGDIDRAVAEYQKLVDANPADAEAAAGLAMAKVLQRTQGVDLQQAREAAAANPDDVDAQTMVADLDMLGGHVDDAFNRLVELVRRTLGRRAQPGPGAPARPLRCRRQRRPARAARPAEPRLRAVLTRFSAAQGNEHGADGGGLGHARRCTATMSRVGTGSCARTATRSVGERLTAQAGDQGDAQAGAHQREVGLELHRRVRDPGQSPGAVVHPGQPLRGRWCPRGWRSSPRRPGRAGVTRLRLGERVVDGHDDVGDVAGRASGGRGGRGSRGGRRPSCAPRRCRPGRRRPGRRCPRARAR